MKARAVPIYPSDDPEAVMRRIITLRFAEILSRSQALTSGGMKGLHDMRIACKRLRYALEIFSSQLPYLSEAVKGLRVMQDTLGELHDCDVLAELAMRCSAELLQTRLVRDRAQLLVRARASWQSAFAPRGEFSALISYAKLR